jgi:serine/threonine protein phosphatase PrpC
MTDVSTSAHGVLRAAFLTDPGRVRTNNEDVPLVDSERGVYGVIDGVGGHAAGEIAAALAGDVILQRLSRPLGTPAERVREAIALANNEIFRRAGESPELRGMTCVVTLAVVSDGLLTIGHVGDSRLYKIRPDGIRKLTHDHSPVGEREDAREISEAEAMRHPRRNEVFRDVGGAYRDKDEENYVDVIEESMERDCAILLCSDGLSDMVPSTMIDRLVRQHAGDPDAVVTALVAVANEAGGKDNVTVVYAEAPDFARSVRSAGPQPAGAGHGSFVAPSASAGRQPNAVVRTAQWILRSRTTWFAAGAAAGVLAALLLVSRMAGTADPISRTLAVGAEGTGAFARISDALLAAKPGDTIRLEPGVYRERVFLPAGVNLIARLPDSVSLGREKGVTGEWVALLAFGDQGGHVSGIRIESTPELPVDVGIRLAGQGWTLDLVELAGPMRTGVELIPGSSAAVLGSHLAVQGTSVTIADRAQAFLAGNVFVRTGRAPATPVVMTGSAQVRLKRNVFAGFSTDIVKGMAPAERQQALAGNVIVAAEPSRVR